MGDPSRRNVSCSLGLPFNGSSIYTQGVFEGKRAGVVNGPVKIAPRYSRLRDVIWSRKGEGADENGIGCVEDVLLGVSFGNLPLR